MSNGRPYFAENVSAYCRARPIRSPARISAAQVSHAAQSPSVAGSDPGPPSNPVIGASLATALKEQLGLRLVSKKGPVQVYVVEKIERPTDN
jgi:uncharacterized protein (TIGR03435 family)